MILTQALLTVELSWRPFPDWRFHSPRQSEGSGGSRIWIFHSQWQTEGADPLPSAAEPFPRHRQRTAAEGARWIRNTLASFFRIMFPEGFMEGSGDKTVCERGRTSQWNFLNK